MFLRTRRIVVSGFLAVAGFVCFGHAARANSVTQTFTLPPNQTPGFTIYGQQMPSLLQFNPSLGTLNSISVSISGTIGGTSASSVSFFTFYESTATFGSFFLFSQANSFFTSAAGPFTLNFTDTSPGELADFTGTGNAGIGDGLHDVSGPAAGVTLTPGSTLTYNYSAVVTPPPPAATPEPASLALLLTGLAGLPALRRRTQGA